MKLTIKDLKDQNLILLECISGSKAYGLDTPLSDMDIKGVFFLPKESFYGLSYTEQVSDEKNDTVYYEIGRFVDLLIKNNPNILELLASPESCVLYRHPLMKKLDISQFLSRQCKETFAGYAMTQIKKAKGLNKKIVNPFPEERKSVIDFCFIIQQNESVPLTEWLRNNNKDQEKCGLVNIPHSKGLYALYYDERGVLNYSGIMKSDSSNDVSLSSVPKGEVLAAYLSFNLESYSSYCKAYKEYWDWVKLRNEERYRSNVQHGREYDSKNMMHTVRLLQTAEEILRTGTLQVKRDNREELLNIKNGAHDYSEILAMAENLIGMIDESYRSSPLPEFPDKQTAENILIEIRNELYK